MSKPITKEYLAKQLKNFESQVIVNNYVSYEENKNIIEKSHEHTNNNVLDKLTESDEGKLLFDGDLIQADSKISEETNNAIVSKEDGIFVDDKQNNWH